MYTACLHNATAYSSTCRSTPACARAPGDWRRSRRVAVRLDAAPPGLTLRLQKDWPDRMSDLRALIWPIYLPSLINQLCEQLTATSVALFALQISGSTALAGAAVGATGLGVVVSNVPASLLYRVLGAQRTLATGQAISGLASVIVAQGCRVRSMALFVAGLALIGVGDATFLIARSSRVREVTTPAVRGRATAMFGGIGRVAQVFGPPAGGFIVGRVGVGMAFMLRGVGLFVGALTVIFSRGFVPTSQALDDTAGGPAAFKRGAAPAPYKQSLPSARRGAARLARRLVVGCLPMFTLSAMRQSRSAIIPLVGAGIGLGPQELGVLVGLASMAETALFIPAGFLYDTIGRKATSIPGMLTMAAGFAVLSRAGSKSALAAASVLIGVGNGLTSGLVQLLAQDLAPPPPDAGNFLSDLVTAWVILEEFNLALALS
eukprot:COSAG02_NODE_353_length_24023_cov_77.872304_11_plen_433_part_00